LLFNTFTICKLSARAIVRVHVFKLHEIGTLLISRAAQRYPDERLSDPVSSYMSHS